MSTNVINQVKTHKLFELIEYYEVCNRGEGKSPKTISWHTANLKNFRNYLKNRHLPDSLENIDTKLLREYVLYLLKKTRYENHPYTPAKTELLAAATVHGHVRTLRAFFNWLVVEGLTQTNSAKATPKGRQESRLYAVIGVAKRQGRLPGLRCAPTLPGTKDSYDRMHEHKEWFTRQNLKAEEDYEKGWTSYLTAVWHMVKRGAAVKEEMQPTDRKQE